MTSLADFAADTIDLDAAFTRKGRTSQASVVDPMIVPVLDVTDRAQVTRCTSVKACADLQRWLKSRAAFYNRSLKSEVRDEKTLVWMVRPLRVRKSKAAE